jgi:hypothetical protein
MGCLSPVFFVPTVHERADPYLVGGGQLLQREGDRPHGSFVEVPYPHRQLHVVLDNLNTHKPKEDRWLKLDPQVNPRSASRFRTLPGKFTAVGVEFVKEMRRHTVVTELAKSGAFGMAQPGAICSRAFDLIHSVPPVPNAGHPALTRWRPAHRSISFPPCPELFIFLDPFRVGRGMGRLAAFKECMARSSSLGFRIMLDCDSVGLRMCT